jgi:hypothetical protein
MHFKARVTATAMSASSCRSKRLKDRHLEDDQEAYRNCNLSATTAGQGIVLGLTRMRGWTSSSTPREGLGSFHALRNFHTSALATTRHNTTEMLKF